MKNTQFLWLGILGLIIVCVWQFSRILELDKRIQTEREMKRPDIETEYQQVVGTLAENQEYLAQLKASALWRDSDDLMLWLTSQAKTVKVEIIGVEQLPTRETNAFFESPMRLKIKGDYHSLGRFINRLERAEEPVKMSHFRMSRLKSVPDLILYLVVAKVQTTGGQI